MAFGKAGDFGRRISTGIKNWVFKVPRGSDIALTLLTFTAFSVIVIEPRIKEGEYNWLDHNAWISIIQSSWLVIIAGLYLKFSERFQKYSPFRFASRYEWTARRTKIARLVAEIGSKRDAEWCRENTELIRRWREWILECSAASAKEFFKLDSNEKVTATLVDFSGPNFHGADQESMFISARTAKGLRVGHTRLRKDLVAFEAIKNGDAAVCHDTHRDPRWNGKPTRYRTVFAVPVSVDNLAFGSLCIESSKPYGFIGRTKNLNALAQPYLALLALTFPEDGIHLECEYDGGHSA